MNGKKARAIRRAYGVKHVRQALLLRREVRNVPRWIGGHVEDVRKRVES